MLQALRQGGFEPRWERVDSPAALGQALARLGWQVVLAADQVPSLSLVQLLSLAGMAAPELPVLVAASAPNPATTRAALQSGAADVIWPAHTRELAFVNTFATAWRAVTMRAAMLLMNSATQTLEVSGVNAQA